MVDFYEVYDTVEEFGGWEHYMTNAEDGYSAWRRDDDQLCELVFYNWDLIGYSDDPCGLRVFRIHGSSNEEILSCILEGVDNPTETTLDFLEEVEGLL